MELYFSGFRSAPGGRPDSRLGPTPGPGPGPGSGLRLVISLSVICKYV